MRRSANRGIDQVADVVPDEVELAEQEMSQIEADSALSRIEMSQNLRGSLQRAITYAHEQFHRQVTLEHLLLALIEDRDAAVILEASAVNTPSLLTEVSDYLGRLEDRAMAEPRKQPALGGDIQHIIQSAGAAAQKSNRNAVSSALVLAAIVGDGRSPAAQMLRNHGMTFETAIAALKQANAAAAAKPVGANGSGNAPASSYRAADPMPAAGVEGARLQNMQAAHEIIASARKRIANARGVVANHSEIVKVTPPAPIPASSPGPADKARATAPSPGSREITQPPPVAPGPTPPVPSPTPLAPLMPQPPSANSTSASTRAAPPATPPRPGQPVFGQSPQPYEQSAPQVPVRTAPPQPRPLDDVPSSGRRAAGSGPIQNPSPGADSLDRTGAPALEPRTQRFQSSDLATVVRPIDPETLAEFIPTRMRIGRPTTVEIRAPRARLEAWSGGSTDPYERSDQIITKAMVMRLKAPEGGFAVEIASPETQWSEGFAGPLSDDVVSWRWIVTPKQRGRLPLLLSVSTRVVGRDGLAAARSLPEQLVSVRVAPNYGRLAGRLMFWGFLTACGATVGYFGDHLFSMGRALLAQVII